MNPLLTVKEVAGILRVHPNTVYQKALSGEIPSVRTSNSRIRFIEKDIKEWLERRSRSSSSVPLFEEALRTDLSLENYDKLFLKGGVEVSPKGKTWNYPFGSVSLRLGESGKESWYIYYRTDRMRVRKVVRLAQSRADALKVLQIEVADAFRGQYGFKRGEKKVRFDEFGKIYIENYAKLNKRSWKDDVFTVDLLNKSFGTMLLQENNPLDIEKFRSKRLSEGVSKLRVNRNLAIMKKMFNLAIDWGYAQANPVRRVRFFSEYENLKERVLTSEEETRLLAACAPYLKSIVITALNTGMRRGEVLGLKWSQISLPQRLIRVERTKSGKVRFIPINDFLFHEFQRLARANGSAEYVFLNPRNRKRLVDTSTGFDTANKRAHITGLRFHDLRHTFASRLVARGVDLITVKDLLGHHSVITTQRYTHSNADQKRRAVQALIIPEASASALVPSVSRQSMSSHLMDS